MWIDGDGVIARLRAQAGDETSSFVTDARFSDLGVPQVIEAPTDFTVVDATVPELFDVMAAVPEEVLDECIPDVQNMSDLSDADFDNLVSCLRDGDADEAATSSPISVPPGSTPLSPQSSKTTSKTSGSVKASRCA